MKIRYKKITDMTGTFPGEIPTSRNEGESKQDYRQRLIEFKRKMYGYRDSYTATFAQPRGNWIPGYKDGRKRA